jgi:hypothetical protein
MQRVMFQVIKDYDANGSDELTVRVGDVLKLSAKRGMLLLSLTVIYSERVV